MAFGAGANIFSDASTANTLSQGNSGWLSTILGGVKSAGQYVADNPNLQRAMAQMGAEIDPQGVGGTVGRAASGMLERQGQQEFMKQLLDALGEGGKVKQGADGTIEMTKGKEGDNKSALSGPVQQPQTGIMSDEDVDSWLSDFMGGS